MTDQHATAYDEARHRGSFSSQRVFILAAVGSAVGLGNIWRFPYVAYENGGGAFLIPYLVALFVAGIPFLWMDYAIGHKHRGSAPLSFARAGRGSEFVGWWQVGICFVIAVYYAAVIAWSLRYTLLSLSKGWGDEPSSYFFGEFLQAGDPGVSMQFVPGVLIPMALVWGAVALIMLLGVQKGIGASAVVFMPLLIAAFIALVIRSLFLPGAAQGLDVLFTPQWSALTDAAVWAAAFGQIFFSLSIGFGIMITYASYVRPRTNMTGSGMVIGLSNSSFEILAGIGVFAALGFMAQAQGVAVDEVATSGIGLAFVAFPSIINQAPAGEIMGLLFFGSLVFAGLSSQISITEVVISAVRDKFELHRRTAVLLVVAPMTVVSLLLFSTASGIYVLDIVDYFINRFGILLVAVVSMVVVAWVLRSLSGFADHLNRFGSIRLGRWWPALLSTVVPAVLTVILVQEFLTAVRSPYESYPSWMLWTFGWGPAAAVIVLGVLAARLPWRPGTSLQPVPSLVPSTTHAKDQT